MKNKVLGGTACRLAKSTGAVRKMAPPAAVVREVRKVGHR